MNGDFSKAGKLGTSLLVKYEPNLIEGMEQLKVKYDCPNITFMLSVQQEKNKQGNLSPFLCLDICQIKEDFKVNILESLPLKSLPKLLSNHYNSPSNDNVS